MNKKKYNDWDWNSLENMALPGNVTKMAAVYVLCESGIFNEECAYSKQYSIL